jgi:hypothetical protein
MPRSAEQRGPAGEEKQPDYTGTGGESTGLR